MNSDTWFKMSSDAERVTRAAADPLNFRIPVSRLEAKRNFLSQGKWNKIPAVAKQAEMAKVFRNSSTGFQKLPPDGDQ